MILLSVMAPRRTVKVREGEKREDAAYDLLVPMGFTRQAIKQKIKELLKVYGGPEGWAFIEEGSYKLLIDELLGGDCTEPALQDETANEGNVHPHASSSSAAVGALNAAAEPPAACEDAGSHQDPDMSQVDGISSTQQEIANSTDDVSLSETSLVVLDLPHAGTDAPRRRRPYHGWVGSGDEDIVVLSPAMSAARLNVVAAAWSCHKCRRG